MITQISVVGFRVGQSWLAVEVQAVAEITDYAPPTPLPHSPPHIPGLLNLRGLALPLLDLGMYLDLVDAGTSRGDAETGWRRVVVVTAARMRVGVVCDQVLGVSDFGPDHVQEVQLTQNRRLVEFARSEIIEVERTLVLLDVSRLLQAAQATG